MSDIRLAVVAAGLGDPSSTKLLADRLTAASEQSLATAGLGVSVSRIELRPLAQQIANQMLTRQPGGELGAAIDTVAGADALIAVTPTFTMSYSGLFKSFFDIVEPDSLRGTPTLLAATGGTARHSMMIDTAMRPLFAYLQALVVPTGVFAAAEDWGSPQGLDGRIVRAADELARFVERLPRRKAADPFDANADGFQSFDQLLGGAG